VDVDIVNYSAHGLSITKITPCGVILFILYFVPS